MTTQRAMKQIRQEREREREQTGMQDCGTSTHPLSEGPCPICKRQDELVRIWWEIWEEEQQHRQVV